MDNHISVRIGKGANEGFNTQYRIEDISKSSLLQLTCERKTGYCLVGKRISRPIGSTVHLGDYSYFWNKKKSVCIERLDELV